MIDLIIICIVFGTFLIVSFMIGARVGQKAVKGEEIKIELPNPVAKIKEHKEIKEASKELEKIDIITQNIDNYDGTGAYQQEIPK